MNRGWFAPASIVQKTFLQGTVSIGVNQVRLITFLRNRQSSSRRHFGFDIFQFWSSPFTGAKADLFAIFK